MIYIIMVLSIAIFVALIMPGVKKIAMHINAFDIPNERKIHKKPIPRLGGLGIFFGLLLGYMIFSEQSLIMNSILIASFLIIIIGMIDDIKPVKARYQFLFQIIAACIIVFYGNVMIDDLTVFGYIIDLKWMTIPLSIFFILGCINIINLIDGLDGLSGGISAIYFLTMGLIGVLRGGFDLQVTLCFIMLGACLGFLFHNFNPARIFAGNSGSMLMGLIISVVALLGFKAATFSSLVIPLLILAIPILDTGFAIIRRKLKKQSIAKPDRFHIHHQLLNKNFSQKTSVLIIYFIDILFAFTSIVFAMGHYNISYVMYGVLMLIVLFFITKTEIIFEHDKNIIRKLVNKFKTYRN